MISVSCLTLSWAAAGRGRWPKGNKVVVTAGTILLGLAYTLFSEWLNVNVRGSWAYSALMPLVPLGFFSIGLSPLLQWLVVPASGFAAVARRPSH